MPSSVDAIPPHARMNEHMDVKMEEAGGERKPTAASENSSHQQADYAAAQSGAPNTSKDAEDEGVEVVLNAEGATNVVNDNEGSPDQNVFRHPQAVRPRVTRAPYPPPYPPYASGSWGYGPPPPPHMDGGGYLGPPPPHHPHAPYPVPPYPASSGSFDTEYGAHQHPTTQYSPHIQYPGPARYSTGEEVNVISPNHKAGDPAHYQPVPRPRGAPYYQYPPTSPVSRPGQGRSLRNYAVMRRSSEPAYTRAQQQHPSEAAPVYESSSGRPWEAYGPPPPPPPPHAGSPVKSSGGQRPQPPVVADSFDSSHRPSTPKSSGASKPPPPALSDPHMQFYGGDGSWGSFDSAGPPPQQHFEDQRYYGFPPDSPYSPYQQPYSPGGLYRAESFPPSAYGPPPLPPSFSYTYEDEERGLLQDYHPDQDGDHHKYVTPPGHSKGKNRSKSSTPISSNMTGGSRSSLLPKAAEEIDFEVADPPMEPITPEGVEAVCESLADVNSYDVLCGRGGGTNSQVGNRRFRQLVQDFQPTYLMAKRKEKPLLARTIVLIIRKRGGRFLKKNEETGELYEVGDTKAEAKTSQALREGLDVRATKSAANAMTHNKKKKPSNNKKDKSSKDKDAKTPVTARSSTESPPNLPHLQEGGGEVGAGLVHPHSPDQLEFRKRRRMRSADRFFNDFMPPRADIHNQPPAMMMSHEAVEVQEEGAAPVEVSLEQEEEAEFRRHADDDGVLDDGNRTPIRANIANSRDEQDDMDFQEAATSGCGAGCAGIALDIVTGAATSSFCLAPAGWRR